jgi:kynureninase
MTPAFQASEEFARSLDQGDPLLSFRDRFHLPRGPDGQPLIYFCGHSLGLQPRGVRALIDQELQTWASLGVEGHFHGPAPWYRYHEYLREPGARLVGARPNEVVFMNGLTVNIHLLLATFYRPTPDRCRILLDYPPFPSDLYALRSQLRHHGYDPDGGLVFVRPRPGELLIRPEDIEELLDRQGERIAVLLLSGVNYLTGQIYEIPRLTRAAQAQGCLVGFDLAHAAGNVPLALHDWNVDFAVWCGYKYLNGGPGAVAGAFIHERHGTNTSLPRLAGWWGNDPDRRFRMHLEEEFIPVAGADGWQLSNPPILALAPLRASLALFDEATMTALRRRSERLTAWLVWLLERLPAGRVQILTPREPGTRGCQVSLLVRDRPREVQAALQEAGVVCDFREPDVIRVATVPLYNTALEVWTFARLLERLVGAGS